MSNHPYRHNGAPPTLLIVAGGTGGHVLPGLAVALAMRARGWQVIWLGNQKGIEATLVPKHGIPMVFIRFGGLRGKDWRTRLMLPLNLLRACWQSLRALGAIKPEVVLGMGGYLTFPAGVMTLLSGRALVLHEQNAIAGWANRALSKFARRVLSAFPNTLPRAQWTGNPVLDAYTAIPPPAQRYPDRSGALRLLVVGGSQGAAALNEIVPRALAVMRAMSASEPPYVVHQAGARHLETVRAHYQAAGLTPLLEQGRIQLLPFIDDMASAYAHADCVICRAGAMTVAEVAATGIAALFVPYPYAVDDHQTANAAFLSSRGAATMMAQRELTADRLAAWLAAQTRAALCAVAARARALAKMDAAERIADVCVAIAGLKSRKEGQP